MSLVATHLAHLPCVSRSLLSSIYTSKTQGAAAAPPMTHVVRQSLGSACAARQPQVQGCKMRPAAIYLLSDHVSVQEASFDIV